MTLQVFLFHPLLLDLIVIGPLIFCTTPALLTWWSLKINLLPNKIYTSIFPMNISNTRMYFSVLILTNSLLILSMTMKLTFFLVFNLAVLIFIPCLYWKNLLLKNSSMRIFSPDEFSIWGLSNLLLSSLDLKNWTPTLLIKMLDLDPLLTTVISTLGLFVTKAPFHYSVISIKLLMFRKPNTIPS